MINIESPHSVLVDGKHYGAVCDTIANNPQLASDIQRALVAYDEALRAAHAAQIAALKQTHADALAVEARFKRRSRAEKVRLVGRKARLAAFARRVVEARALTR